MHSQTRGISRRILVPAVAALALAAGTSARARQSVLYGGGPLYVDAAAHRGMIRASGFTTLVIWTIHVEADGDLVLNNHKIIDDGAYVGRADWPAEVAAFKSGPTSVARIEVGLSGHGSQTFLNIRDLVFSQGTDPGDSLYRNFQALKQAVPSIDGINFDEESHIYDENVPYTMKQFSLMLADLGFNIELDVFCCSEAWVDLLEFVNGARPGTIDRIDLQCYAGGGGNDPCWWNGRFGGLRVTPGLWAYPSSESGGYWSRTPDQVLGQMSSWNSSCNIAGGFMWYLDDMLLALDRHPVAGYADAINAALGIDPSRGIAATIHEHTDYRGWGVEVGEGPHGEIEVGSAGGAIGDVSSIKVMPGWQVNLFSEANFWGDTLVRTADDPSLVDDGWNDRVKSLIVSRLEDPVVRLHQHTDYWGWSARLEVGSHTLADLVAAGGANDDASSIEVPPGFIVTLYEHDNLRGASLVRTADDATLVDDGWNDRVSSMTVAIDPAGAGAVTVYQDAGYWGGWSARFAPGAYDLDAIIAAGGLNDDITSLKVAPGYAVILYEHDHFRGDDLVLVSDDLCLFDDGWNDRVSSMIVTSAGGVPYAAWAIAAGLEPGVNDDPACDPDGDGRPNLREFALDGDPLSTIADGKVATTFAGPAAAARFVLTLPVRAGAVFVPGTSGARVAAVDGVSYQVSGSLGLDTFDAAVEELAPPAAAGMPALSSGWEYRSFRLAADRSSAPRGFLVATIGPSN